MRSKIREKFAKVIGGNGGAKRGLSEYGERGEERPDTMERENRRIDITSTSVHAPLV